jgi:hypothetical protein
MNTVKAAASVRSNVRRKASKMMQEEKRKRDISENFERILLFFNDFGLYCIINSKIDYFYCVTNKYLHGKP